ncbi:GNAT family N-acetyltransferase [Goekera deserti]|uniref:GNAT family N-acetyltransferase n=1 Tax=Goekera deserti TaxID=2497753 RepID=UPI00128D1A23|nr:N-acetyltransferase [Goekera deserti]
MSTGRSRDDGLDCTGDPGRREKRCGLTPRPTARPWSTSWSRPACSAATRRASSPTASWTVGDDGGTCLVEDAEDGRGLAAVLLYRPEESADRAFDLTMIAVRPDLQGGGRGAALVRHAEDDLQQRGQRLLLMRTSGTPQYDRTRAFYRDLSYTEHTRVPDYWTDGDDLVVFSRRLSARAASHRPGAFSERDVMAQGSCSVAADDQTALLDSASSTPCPIAARMLRLPEARGWFGWAKASSRHQTGRSGRLALWLGLGRVNAWSNSG